MMSRRYTYGAAGNAWFEGQIAIAGDNGSFGSGGDSGSLILSKETNQPVALLFAGGDTITFGNPIDLVLSRFQAQII